MLSSNTTIKEIVMKKIIVAVLLFVNLTSVVFAANHQHHKSGDVVMDHKMMASMNHSSNIQYSENDNVAFVKAMIPHHEGAIIMSQKQLPKITDPEIKKLAENIIIAQKQEIKFMKNWLNNKSVN
ncbi:DUF305 domain-containing protein [Aliivibrio fischeri]|nr:DUF305 domain-containing protein [Aliivibrio fischeri]